MLKIIFYNFLVLIFLVIFIESSFYFLYLVKGKEPPGWLIKVNNESIKEMKNPCKRMIQHPILSRIHDHNDECKIPGGFVDGEYVFYDNYDKNKSAIVTFGGSTTDGMRIDLNRGQTWPRLLNDKLYKYNVTVINGAVASHGSVQTNLKLNFLKNSIPNNIKTVISLEGINEIKAHYSYETPYSGLSLEENSNWPYMTDNLFSSYLYETWFILNQAEILILPNINKAISRLQESLKKTKKNIYKKNISSSKKNIYSPAELWEINGYKNYYLSKSLGAEFILILQPAMGVSDNQTPSFDIKGSNDWDIFNRANPDYFKNMRSFYRILKKKCSKMNFCYDLSDSVTPITGNLFNDYRHHNEHGNMLLANDIFNIIISKNKVIN